jgi:hypothetical protein
MFDWLFPGWSNPGIVAAFVALRAVVNGLLTALVARVEGARSRLTALVGGLSGLSVVMVVLVLRPGTLGHPASYVELMVGSLVPLLSGVAVYRHRTRVRLLSYLALLVPCLFFLLWTVVLYGEAFVAP